MKKAGSRYWLLFGVLAIGVLVFAVWILLILNANWIGRRDFSATPCWFVQENNPQNLPGLATGPRGFYMPNPFRQLNRRFFGFGLDEPNNYAPHFAVAVLDAEGRPALWAWSYRNNQFWPLSEVSQSRGGVVADFVDEATISAACPDLSPPLRSTYSSAGPR